MNAKQAVLVKMVVAAQTLSMATLVHVQIYTLVKTVHKVLSWPCMALY